MSSKVSKLCSTLYDNEAYSDVVLSVGQSRIHAHKLVLSAHSNYFATMFNSDFRESKQEVVTIQDDESHFKQMIKIFYTNDTSELNFDMAMHLIVLANKYLVDDLILTCQKIILENMTVDNCLDVLLVADSIASKQFRNRCASYISTNIKSVIATPRWETLKAQRPDLFIEVAAKMVEKVGKLI
jgi:speckle-type POZ protein